MPDEVEPERSSEDASGFDWRTGGRRRRGDEVLRGALLGIFRWRPGRSRDRDPRDAWGNFR